MEENKGDKGYGDKKLFKCVCCGKDVLATKFASALSVKCDDCKKQKLPPNADIIAQIKAEKNAHKAATAATQDDDVPDGKKRAKCVQCGKDIFIGKFASAKTCMCDECKGVSSDTEYNDGVHIDLSKIDRSTLPAPDEAYVMPQLINNHRLREVTCPACGHEFMKIIKIIDCSPVHGLVIVYQCHKCMFAMTASEQTYVRLSAQPIHKLFNYRGEEIHELTDTIQDVRTRNAIEYLLKLCGDNNIDVSGVDLPEYIRQYKDIEVKKDAGIDPGISIIDLVEAKFGQIPGDTIVEKAKWLKDNTIEEGGENNEQGTGKDNSGSSQGV